MLKGEPARVDWTSPRCREKTGYEEAVCAESGEVAAVPLGGHPQRRDLRYFLEAGGGPPSRAPCRLLGQRPAHSGDPICVCLATLDLRLRLVRLPAHSPDLNAAEPLWDWVRDEVMANTCFGTARRRAPRSLLRQPGHPAPSLKSMCESVRLMKAYVRKGPA